MKWLPLAFMCLAVPASVHAQPAPYTIRGFGDVGVRTFTASRSFDAIFGRHAGVLVGGGVDIIDRRGFFAGIHLSRLSGAGQRVFVFADQVFPLDAENTITIAPLELTGGYRFARLWHVVPYAGGGVGWHHYRESSPASTNGEDVSDTFLGYHALGGAEMHVWRWISAAAEVQWTTIPDALGSDPNGVSHAFGESNLGGLSARLKIIVRP